MTGIQFKRSIQDEKLVEAIFTASDACRRNWIMDPRPRVNALANQVSGAGMEDPEHYFGCSRTFLNIDNIHVMRDSQTKLVCSCSCPVSSPGEGASGTSHHHSSNSSHTTPYPPKPKEPIFEALHAEMEGSRWFYHIEMILNAVVDIVRAVHLENTNVLVHCSDGWDRTSQCTSLAMLLLDPYYRTFRGLQVLIEKEWCSFGHKFRERSGHMQKRPSGVPASSSSSNASKAANNSVSLSMLTTTITSIYPGASASEVDHARLSQTQPQPSSAKEVSPVFAQFLECIVSIGRQYPTAFEFQTTTLMPFLHYHLYSCHFGNFLCNNERERITLQIPSRTMSIWDWVNNDKDSFINPDYEPWDGSSTARVLGLDGIRAHHYFRLWTEVYTPLAPEGVDVFSQDPKKPVPVDESKDGLYHFNKEELDRLTCQFHHLQKQSNGVKDEPPISARSDDILHSSSSGEPTTDKQDPMIDSKTSNSKEDEPVIEPLSHISTSSLKSRDPIIEPLSYDHQHVPLDSVHPTEKGISIFENNKWQSYNNAVYCSVCRIRFLRYISKVN